MDALIEFHMKANTPLWRLGNGVRWFEECATRSTGYERKAFSLKAADLRLAISTIFARRDAAGQYADALLAAR